MPDNKYVLYQKANIKSIMFGIIAILISFLLLNYFVMPTKKEYSLNFTYNIASLDNGLFYDGSKFNYKLIISNENLHSVASKNIELSSIDINKMISENGIEIYNNKNNYTLTVNSKYFNNKAQVRIFFDKLCNQPVNVSNSIIKNYCYQTELKNYNNANTLDTKINCLINQTKLIKEKYESLLEKYGDISVINNKKISDTIREIELFEGYANLSSLELEVERNGYVLLNDNAINELKYKKLGFEDELRLTNNKLNSLINVRNELLSVSASIANLNISNLNKQIVNLTLTKIDLENEIDILDNKINLSQDNSSLDVFINKIDNYHKELSMFTSELEQNEISILTNDYRVIYNSNINMAVNIKYEIVLAIEALLIGVFVGVSTNYALKFFNTQTFKSVRIRERFRFTRYM